MADMDLYSEIGKIIKKYRVQLQMSQRELAKGICNPSHITHIENGNRSPNAVILFQIAEKLKIPVALLFSPYSYELTEMMSNLALLTASNASRTKLMEYITFIEENYQMLSHRDSLLIEGLRSFIKAVEEKNYKEGIEKLTLKLDAYSKHHAYISPIEFAVENAINWLYFLDGNIDYSFMKFKEAYFKIPHILAFENYIFITKFFVQIAVVSIEKESYETAIRYLDEGIEYNQNKATHTLLPELLYHKGEAKYLLGDKEAGLELILESIKLSHLINQRHNDFIKFIKPRLQKYSIDEIEI